MTNFVLCIHVQIRFASTEKNYSHRLACILLVVFLVTKKTTLCCHSRCLSVRPSVRLSVRPSSVEISLERGSKRSAKPIDLKIGLDMDN